MTKPKPKAQPLASQESGVGTKPQPLGTERIRAAQTFKSSIGTFSREFEADLASLIADFWPVALEQEMVEAITQRNRDRLLSDLLVEGDPNA